MMEVTPDSPMNDLPHVRGERPTRAGPSPRAEAPDSSAAGNGPWGGTRPASRGAGTKWSVRDELVRSRMVAWQIGAPALAERVARVGSGPSDTLVGCRRIGPRGAARDYRGRRARRYPTMTTGTLTPSPPMGGVTVRYKHERNPGRMRRWRGWPDLRLWRTQHPPHKARPMAGRARGARLEASR